MKILSMQNVYVGYICLTFYTKTTKYIITIYIYSQKVYFYASERLNPLLSVTLLHMAKRDSKDFNRNQVPML